jgi:ribosomal protein S18 acetylase RimI-like enzyme
MTSDIALRLAVPAERGELIALQFRASLMWEEDRARLLADPNLIDIPLQQFEEGRVFVAERGGKTLGFGVVLLRDDGQAELDGLFVEPEHGRQGIGSCLVREAERLALHDGATSLHVTANPRAMNFYIANGFEVTGEAQTLFGPAPTVRKALERRCS